MSRQRAWSLAIVGLLLVYIGVDLYGKSSIDRSLGTSDYYVSSSSGVVSGNVVVGHCAASGDALGKLVEQEKRISSLAEELAKAKQLLTAMNNAGSSRRGGAVVYSDSETAESMTRRFLQEDFPHQAPLPGAQCIAGVGIPGVDSPSSRQRRVAQRETWHTYAGVTSGAITVRYLLAKHAANDYRYSDAAIEEARTNGDVYALKMREGIPTQRQEGMKAGYWGFTAALGISRKGLNWYRMAAYYNCSYVLKGDDDMYWNVPQYLHDLAMLPKSLMMWGKGMHYGCRKKSSHCVYFVVGMVLTMSRDVAMAITHVKDFLPWADAVEADDREDSLMAIKGELQAWTFDHEDVLVGRLLRESALNVTVYDDFRFHDCGTGMLVKPVNKWSMVMHRACGDYKELRKRFTEQSVIDWKLILEPWIWKQDHKVPVIDRGTFVGFEHRIRYQFLQRVHPPGEPRWD